MNLSLVLEILALLIPLIHAAGILCAAHAILFARTSQGAIAWAMSLVFVPYVAIILYLMLGRQRFHGYVEARRSGDRRIDHLAANLMDTQRVAHASLPGDAGRFDVFNHLSVLPFTAGNWAQLLIDGQQTFDAIFEAIRSARQYLLVQFFIVRDDNLGRQLQELLIARAKAGVKVLFLYDEIGSFGLPGHFLRDLAAAGVQVSAFNSRRGWRNRFQINFRNHRKIVVADGITAFVGGHNVGDEYMGRSTRFGPWRDTHVALTGPVVAAVEWAFIEDWHWATEELLDLPRPEGHPAPPTGGGAAAIVLNTGPADEVPECTLMFLAAFASARKRLWITSPYFVPEEAVYDALQLAALRGVDVRVMLPAKPDHLLVYLSGFSYLESAERVGVKFYRYTAGFLHQKVMLIDDDLAAVGTANLDNRSTRLNFEMTVLVADRAFADQTAAMLEADFAQCERATPGDLGRRTVLFRVMVRMARLFSPLQ